MGNTVYFIVTQIVKYYILTLKIKFSVFKNVFFLCVEKRQSLHATLQRRSGMVESMPRQQCIVDVFKKYIPPGGMQ